MTSIADDKTLARFVKSMVDDVGLVRFMNMTDEETERLDALVVAIDEDGDGRLTLSLKNNRAGRLQ